MKLQKLLEQNFSHNKLPHDLKNKIISLVKTMNISQPDKNNLIVFLVHYLFAGIEQNQEFTKQEFYKLSRFTANLLKMDSQFTIGKNEKMFEVKKGKEKK